MSEENTALTGMYNTYVMSQGDVFVYLLSSKEPTTVKALGTFLHNAFMKREKAMNHYQC